MERHETGTLAGHPRRPLLWICGCFISGIIINEYSRIPFVTFALAAMVFIIASLMLTFFLPPAMKRFFLPSSRIATLCLFLATVALGAVYAKNYQTFPPDHIAKLSYGYHDCILLEGKVISDVEQRPFFKGRKTTFVLEAVRIKSRGPWRVKRGMILVNLFRPEDIRYGDDLLLEGKLFRPFNFANDNNFSYREYLYRKGITFILSVKKKGRLEVLRRNQGHFLMFLSLRLKHRFSAVLKKYLPKEAAGIMVALLLGDRYDIPKMVYDLFKLSGVAHIIAISGFNIAIVAYGIFFCLKMFPIPRRGQYVLNMLLLIFYAFLTGGQPPVVRATIMAVVFLMSYIVEREADSINTLSLAALVILLMNPLNLFDVGFQLSFISVLSIILFYPRCMNVLYRLFPWAKSASEEKIPDRKSWGATIKIQAIQYLLQSTALSLSAYLGVVVLIAYYFRLVTPIVILANMVIVPLTSLIIYLGMGLLIAGLLVPFLAFAFANCISVLLNFTVASVCFFAGLPGAYFQLKTVPLAFIFLYYGLIIFGIFSRRLINRIFKRENRVY